MAKAIHEILHLRLGCSGALRYESSDTDLLCAMAWPPGIGYERISQPSLCVWTVAQSSFPVYSTVRNKLETVEVSGTVSLTRIMVVNRSYDLAFVGQFLRRTGEG